MKGGHGGGLESIREEGELRGSPEVSVSGEVDEEVEEDVEAEGVEEGEPEAGASAGASLLS
jgi:hypothetical protein